MKYWAQEHFCSCTWLQFSLVCSSLPYQWGFPQTCAFSLSKRGHYSLKTPQPQTKMGVDQLIRTKSFIKLIDRHKVDVSHCRWTKKSQGEGGSFHYFVWCGLISFLPFPLGCGFQVSQSLSCFPKASSSFTISCVNHPEEMRHSCQNNILQMKQEDVFSWWVVWMSVISWAVHRKGFHPRSVARTEFAQLMCCHRHSWAQTELGPPLCRGHLSGLTCSWYFSKMPTKPKLRLFLCRARNGCACSSLKGLKTTVFSKFTWLWERLETQIWFVGITGSWKMRRRMLTKY